MTIPLDESQPSSSDPELTQASSSNAVTKEQIGPYRLMQQLGEGGMGEVWLAEQTKPVHRQVALKIINANYADDAQHEKEIESYIAQQNPEHRGRVILRTCLTDFEITGPEGKHMCLVYEPMREPLWILQRRFIDRKLPLPIAKAYIYILLVGLDYLHSECNVVHAGKCLSPFPCSYFGM